MFYYDVTKFIDNINRYILENFHKNSLFFIDIKDIDSLMNLLLKEVNIKLTNKNKTFIIEPIWLELYFYKVRYDEDKSNIKLNVIDLLIHKNDKQKNNFLKLYFHNSFTKYNGCRSGVDLVLSSDNETYFSIILKGMYCYFDNKVIKVKQSELHKLIYLYFEGKEDFEVSLVKKVDTSRNEFKVYKSERVVTISNRLLNDNRYYLSKRKKFNLMDLSVLEIKNLFINSLSLKLAYFTLNKDLNEISYSSKYNLFTKVFTFN